MQTGDTEPAESSGTAPPSVSAQPPSTGEASTPAEQAPSTVPAASTTTGQAPSTDLPVPAPVVYGSPSAPASGGGMTQVATAGGGAALTGPTCDIPTGTAAGKAKAVAGMFYHLTIKCNA